jgi:hypothetical protein
MKRVITFFTVLFITNISFGQSEYIIDFDSQYSADDHIIIDTLTNPDNIWEIGIPDKALFHNAHSPVHAIVTDTLNQYPVNDTSSFIIKHFRAGWWGTYNWELKLYFWFMMDSDTLTDYGKIEASIDNGLTWIDLLSDTCDFIFWDEPKPVLTGNSGGWQHFAADLVELTYQIGYSDTLLYRFTFISDSIQTNKDGWIIDDFHLTDYWEGVDEYKNSDLIDIFPNPSNGNFTIESDLLNKSKFRIEIYDITGNLLINEVHYSKHFKLNLQDGMYFVKIIDGENVYLKRLIIKNE